MVLDIVLRYVFGRRGAEGEEGHVGGECAARPEKPHAVHGGGVAQLAVEVEYAVGRSEGQHVRGYDSVGAGKGEPLFVAAAVGTEEGDRHAVVAHQGGGAHAVLADGDADIVGGLVAFALADADVVVVEAGVEDVEVKEAGEVDAAVAAERVAQAVGVDVAEGAAFHEGAQGGVEERVAEVAAQRVPHHGPFVVGGGAVGVGVGHAVQREVRVVGVVCGAQHVVEVALVGGVGGAAAVSGLACHLAREAGAAFVYPHVALFLAGDEVAEPGVAQFVGYGALSGLADRCHCGSREGYVVDVFHGAHGGAYVAYAPPAVGAEALLELGHHGVEEGVDAACRGAVLRGVAYRQRVSGHGVVDAAVVGLAYADDICAHGLRYLPGGVLAAVAVDAAALEHAAALGGPSGLGLHLYGVGGLVVEVVAAGEHGAAYGVEGLAEGGAEVVAHVVVEVEAAEAVALHVAAAAVGHGDGEGVADGDAAGRYVEYVVAGSQRVVDLDGVDVAREVKAYLAAGAQQAGRQQCVAAEWFAVAQVELQAVVQHVDRVGRLRLHRGAAQQHRQHCQ